MDRKNQTYSKVLGWTGSKGSICSEDYSWLWDDEIGCDWYNHAVHKSYTGHNSTMNFFCNAGNKFFANIEWGQTRKFYGAHYTCLSKNKKVEIVFSWALPALFVFPNLCTVLCFFPSSCLLQLSVIREEGRER